MTMTTLLEPPTIFAAGKPPFHNEGADAPAPARPTESGEVGGNDDVETENESESEGGDA